MSHYSESSSYSASSRQATSRAAGREPIDKEAAFSQSDATSQTGLAQRPIEVYGATESVQAGARSIPSTVYSSALPNQQIKPGVFRTVSQKGEPPPRKLLVSAICEFIGTFLLTFTVACCPQGLWAPTVIAAVFVALIYAFGWNTGAHLNPAISMATFLAGKITGKAFVGYFLAQIIGGVLGGFLFRVSFGATSFALSVMPVAPFTFGLAAAVEMIYTTMLCFVALNVLYSATMTQNHFYGVAIGFAIVAGGYAAHDISGAVLNPAFALAFSLNLNIGWGLWYFLFELGGAIIAALLFKLCRRSEYVETHTLYEIEAGDHQTLYDVTSSDPPSLGARMGTEFVGTFLLVLTYGLNIILTTGATAWSVAAALLSLMYALATLSGGHFNPAVTFAVVLSGRSKCSARDGRFYVLAQLVAAIPAGCLLSYVHSHGPLPKAHFGLAIEYTGYMWYQTCIVEALFTFILAFVVLTVATSEAHTNAWPNFYFALAIGLTVGGAVYAVGNVSGGYLNPAVVLGFAVEGEQRFASYLRCLFYWIPELFGACAAAGAFRIAYSAEFTYKSAY